MTNSTHPLTGKTDAVNAWIAFLKMIAITCGIFVLVTGFWTVDWRVERSFVFNGVHISWAVLVPIAAWIVYWHESYVGRSRPATTFYGWLDFLGSLVVFIVSLGGLLSLLPPTVAIMERFGLPMAKPSELTYVIVFVFILCSTYDVFWRQWRRAGGVSSSTTSTQTGAVVEHKHNVIVMNRWDEKTIRRIAEIVAEEFGGIIR